MKFYYQGVDISPSISLHSVLYTDVAGDKADRLDITFNDVNRQWASWGVQTGDECRFIEASLDTGVLYVESHNANNGLFTIGAISIPASAKTAKHRAFENVRFQSLAAEIAGQHGFSLEVHSAPNVLYERMRQDGEGDFAFVSRLAKQEGCTVKAYDKKMVLYKQSYMEGQSAIVSIDISRYDTYTIFDTDARSFEACEVMTYGGPIRFDAPDVKNGRILKIDKVMAANEGEALRFAQGLLRTKNRTKSRCRLPIDLRTDITAGSVVTVQGEGVVSSPYFIYQAEHNLTTVQTILHGRKPLGY